MAPAPSHSPLEGAWTAYRTWSQTSVYHKNRMDSLIKWSLWTAIAGACLAGLSPALAAPWPKILGPASAVLVALAAYLTQQALAGDRVRTWTRARGAAESLKSGLYLYRAAVPPFDAADRNSQMASRVGQVMESLKDIESRPHDNKPVPPLSLTVEQYIAERVDEQVKWYEKRAAEHQTKADLFRKLTVFLGGVSALLALVAAMLPVSGAIGVIATITTSITAHLKNQQYQTLVAAYRTAAIRLRTIKSEWVGIGKTDADKKERDLFIQRCEETMAAENGAWAALWMEKPA